MQDPERRPNDLTVLVILLLRVYALYHRPRIVGKFLMTSFLLQFLGLVFVCASGTVRLRSLMTRYFEGGS